jgi:hypothetical protein
MHQKKEETFVSIARPHFGVILNTGTYYTRNIRYITPSKTSRVLMPSISDVDEVILFSVLFKTCHFMLWIQTSRF